MYEVSFPGLGIENLAINSTAFSIFGRDIKWYGIIITVGMIFACLYALTRAKFEKISSDDLTDFALFAIIFGIIGCRVYYVIFHFDSFLVTTEETFFANFLKTARNCVAIWEGGLAIYGGIIAGAITIMVICKIKKIKILKFFDVASASVIIGQIFGRWGNFMNQEAFGTNTTLPWGMYSDATYSYLSSHKAALAEMGITVNPTLPVHPTFLYESLWNLIGFLIMHVIYKKKKYDGQIFLIYVAWYGFGRMIIEEFRTDSLMIGNFRVSQLVALVSMLIAVAFLLINAIRKKCEYNYAEIIAAEEAETEAAAKITEEEIISSGESTLFSADDDEADESESDGNEEATAEDENGKDN